MLLLSTFGVCLLSALFPVVNAETYVGALAAVGSDASQLWPIALIGAVGQTIGKVAFFYLGRSSLNWRWVRRKTETPKWQARMERWQARTHRNPATVFGLVSVSAVVGLPPLAIISVLVGQLRSSIALFIVAVFAGRTLRFAAIFGGVALLGAPMA
ncbi:MAG: VTT domain-containing protein [Nocardioidaceae bacterium]